MHWLWMNKRHKLEASSFSSVTNCSAGLFAWSPRRADKTGNSNKVTTTHLEVTYLGNSFICQRLYLMKPGRAAVHYPVKMDIGSLDWQGERWERLGPKCSSCWAVSCGTAAIRECQRLWHFVSRELLLEDSAGRLQSCGVDRKKSRL